MAQALSAMLPGADAYYAQQRPEQQHLTLGRFGGSDAAGFAAWLSDSLAGQNSLLPTFTGSHVQLSDEARPFPNHPIPLGGGGAAGGGAFGGGWGRTAVWGRVRHGRRGSMRPSAEGRTGPIGAAPIGPSAAHRRRGAAPPARGRWARPPRPPRRRRRPARPSAPAPAAVAAAHVRLGMRVQAAARRGWVYAGRLVSPRRALRRASPAAAAAAASPRRFSRCSSRARRAPGRWRDRHLGVRGERVRVAAAGAGGVVAAAGAAGDQPAGRALRGWAR